MRTSPNGFLTNCLIRHNSRILVAIIVFTMLHVVFVMFRTWRHAGEREFLNCFFSDKQQAARLRILAWASIAENPGCRQVAEISLAENSWLRTPGS